MVAEALVGQPYLGDLTVLLGDWGSDESAADLNDDGLVDGQDLTQLLGEWGPCPLQGSWTVLASAPVAPYLHHDDIAVIGDTLWICNVSGQPAASLPVQLKDGEHPCAVQLAGHTGKDHLILQVAAELEKEFGWHQYRPPIWAGDLQ